MAPAGRSFVINASLCFVMSKYNKISAVKIAEILCDCFTHEDITAAKTQLVNDVQNSELNLSSNNLRARRDADRTERQRKEAVDIVTVITTLDQQGSISSLPIYVVDNTDSIPSLKLEDGELKYLMARVDKLDNAMFCVQQTLNRLHAYVITNVSLKPAEATPVVSQTTGEMMNFEPNAINMQKHCSLLPGGQPLMHVPSNMHGTIQQHSSTIQSTCVGATQTSSTPARTQKQSQSILAPSPSVVAMGAGVNERHRNWADIHGSTSSVIDTDNATTGATDDDEFTMVESRRTKRRRRHATHQTTPGVTPAGPSFNPPPFNRQQPATNIAKSHPRAAATAAGVASTGGGGNANKQSRKPLVVGTLRSPAARQIGNLAAAKPLYGKAVFYVDNVNKDVTADDLEHFVKTTLGVRVINCNKTKTRRSVRQRRENITPDHVAFCLCINKADTDLLMRPDKWPADISVSAWYFKPKKDAENTADDRQQPGEQQQSVVMNVVADVHAPPPTHNTDSVADIVAAAAETNEIELMTLSPPAAAAETSSNDQDDSAGNSTADTVVNTSVNNCT